MNDNEFDVIIVGAGFAGLCASYYVKKYGLSHMVFERGQIGESWPIPGFYLLGYPWLRTRKSPILFGIKDDAKFIVDRIYNYSRENSHSGGVVV
jgi:cation diffusion facilitator CzcD-associated flavoprotein CzcO